MRFPPPDPAARVVLHHVLATASRLGGAGVAVFDLDSTLLDNRPRQRRILQEYGEATGEPRLAASALEHWTSSWLLEEAMRAAGLADHEVAARYDEVMAFWRERFFHPAYCAEDLPVPGARDFVAAIHEAGAQVVYCTARHEEMREATAACLVRHGFPAPGSERAALIMKPGPEIGDDDFKRSAHRALQQLGQVFAAFDNEPTHVNDYLAGFPDAHVVHLATDHSGRGVAVDPRIPQVANFLLPTP